MLLRKHSKRIAKTIRLSWPIAIAQLGAVLMGVVDTVMVGKLGPEPLASMAMSNTLWYFNLVLAFGIISAISPLISSAYGAKEHHRIGPLISHGIRFAIVLSVFTIVMFRFSGPIFRWLGQDPMLVEIGNIYLMYFSFGVPAHYAFYSLRMFTDSTSNTKPALVVFVLGLLMNILFNDLLIFGKHGFPRMEVAGAALATSIVGWLMFLSMLSYVSLSKRYQKMRIFQQQRKPDFTIVKTIFHLGFPVGASNLAEVAFFMFCTLLIGTIGAAELASHQIALNLASISFMIATGVSQAISIQIGQAYGRKHFQEIRGLASDGYVLISILMILVTFVFVLFPEQLILLYTSDPKIVSMATPLVRIAGAFQIGDGLQVLGIYCCKGLQDTKIPFLNAMVSFWIFGAPVSLLALHIFNLSYWGVWLGMVVGLGVASVLHALRFIYVLKVRA